MNITVTGSSSGINSCQEHQHPNWELVFMIDGNCTTKINQQLFQLKKGSIFIIPPGMPHSTASIGSYSDMFLQCDVFPAGLTSPTLLQDFDGNIGQLFSLIHVLYLKNSAEHQPVLRSLGDALVSYLQIGLGSSEKTAFFISEIKATLETNLAVAEFDLSAYLKSLGYNVDYIRRCFKQECHVTPLQYLQSLRLAYANSLLHNTYYTIGEIANLCGFSDPYYFSRTFKKQYRISPCNVRKGSTNGHASNQSEI